MKKLQNKEILVTGGVGFLGSHIVEKLIERGVKEENIEIPKSRTCDLRIKENIQKVVKNKDIIFHSAATVGGIEANRKNPGKFFYDNAIMGIQLIHESWKAGVEKFVCIGTICSYPKYTSLPIREKNLWSGYPSKVTAPYGIAKKMLIVQLQTYKDQYGFNGISLLPVNLYGPRDNFNLETSHVIPALIRKCVSAVENDKKEIVCWGDGNQTREFLYVKDAAEGILLAAEKYNETDPVNLGSGHEISIEEIVNIIADLTKFNGDIVWDIKKPKGQPRRWLDISKAEENFGFRAKTPLKQGLKETIIWFKSKY